MPLPGDVREQDQEFVARERVEARERLIEQQDVGPRAEGVEIVSTKVSTLRSAGCRPDRTYTSGCLRRARRCW